MVRINKESAPQRRRLLCIMLKKAVTFMLCLLLCVCLVFGTSYRKPAHAFAITIGGAVLFVLAAAALGVTISNIVGNSDEIAEGFYNDVDRVYEGSKYIVDQTTGKIHMATDWIEAVGNKLKDYWSQAETNELGKLDWVEIKTGAVPHQEDEIKQYLDIPTGWYARVNGNHFYMSYGMKILKRVNNPAKGQVISLDFSGNHYDYTVAESSNSLVWAGFILNHYPDDTYHVMNIRVAVSSYTQLTDLGAVDYDTGADDDLSDARRESLYLHGKSILAPGNTVGGVLGDIKSAVGSRSDALPDGRESIEVTNTGSATKLDANTITQTQAQTVGAEIATDADYAAADAVNAATGATSARPMDFPNISIPEMIVRKFPFSLPWDLYKSVLVLASPGEAPVWDIPFKMPLANIDYTFHIDLHQFDTLAALCRWGISLIFLVGLIFSTRKMIWK